MTDFVCIYLGMTIGLLLAVVFGPPSDATMAVVVMFTLALLVYSSIGLAEPDPDEEKGHDWKDRP